MFIAMYFQHVLKANVECCVAGLNNQAYYTIIYKRYSYSNPVWNVVCDIPIAIQCGLLSARAGF
jgi:hypothetical protein